MYLKAYKTTQTPQGEIETTLTDYTELLSLSFTPLADPTGATLPVNEFEADIHTPDELAVGSYAELYDDADRLWAAYWVISSERVGGGLLRVRAQSPVALLDRALLPAVYYDRRPVRAALEQILGEAVSLPYALDPAFEGATLTGFCPEQTPRERLLWVCFALGLRPRTCFNQRLELLGEPDGSREIPMADTYWRPTLRYGDWVTAVRVRAYRFTEGEPGPTDDYVTSGTGVNYLVTKQDFTLRNPEAPALAPENVVSVDGVMLISPDNVSEVLTRLGRWAFCRAEADVDAIDNGDIVPGDRVTAHIDDDLMVSGYVSRAAFSFGAQAKASLRLVGVTPLASAALTVRLQWGGVTLARAVYRFPVGFAYAVDNPWPDWTMNGHRYIFRPLNPRAEGVVPEGGATRDEPCAPALDLFEGVLGILAADELTDNEGTVKLK